MGLDFEKSRKEESQRGLKIVNPVVLEKTNEVRVQDAERVDFPGRIPFSPGLCLKS